MPMPRITTETITEHLRDMRSSATADHVTEGRAWYDAMLAFIRTVAVDAAEYTGDFAPDPLAVGIFAARSMNQTWKGNVTLATGDLRGETPGGLPAVLAEIDALENGADPTDYEVLGLKRADFCANLLGDHERVTCDRWHLRAAYRLTDYPNRETPRPMGVQWTVVKNKRGEIVSEGPTVKLTPRVHADVTEATRIVAAENGETPAQCQAVIWCAVRGSGE